MKVSIYSFVFALIGSLILNPTFAQLETDNTTLTIDEVVNEFLLGEGIDAFNITFNGFDATGQTNVQIGSFNGENTVLGMDEGLILASGGIDVAEGPNDSGTSSSPTTNPGAGCPDLNDLIPGFTLNDRAILEFDFIPAGDTVRFNYIWGSEEYPEFVNSSFNDVFGFFISGPDLNGPFTNNAINIAIIPGTDPPLPVTIDNVNADLNSEYYVDNTQGTGNDPQYIQFDGYTVSLEAVAPVICGEVYHIKIALADAGDSGYDSAVFLEKGSFTSEAVVEIVASPIRNGIEVGENDFSDGVLSGCTDAQFCLSRADTIGVDTVNFEISGSAQAGVQYELPENTFVVFQEGEDTICIDVISLANDLGADVDSLVFSAFSIDPCTGDTIETSASILFYNEYSFEVSTEDVILDCPQEFVTLSGGASAGISPYSYQWLLTDSTTEVGTGANFQVEAPPMGESDTYILSVTDACGLEPEFESITVTNNSVPAPEVNVEATSGDTIGCVGQTVDLMATATGGQGELEYLWSNNDSGSETTVTPSGNETITYYFVIVTDECGNTGTDSIPVYFIPEPPMVSISTSPSDTVHCLGDVVELTANASSPAGSIDDYNWSSTSESTETITVEPDGSETVTYYYVTVTDECFATATDSVAIYFIPLNPPIANPGEDVTVECPGDEVELTATAIGGSAPYQYQWDPIDSTQQSITVSPQGTMTYTLTITDDCFAVSEPAEVTVNVPVYDPVTVELPSPTSVCPGDIHVLTPDVSGGAGIYDYEWSPGGQISSSITVDPSQPAQFVVQVTDQCGNVGQGNSIVNMPDYEDIDVTPKATPSCTGDSFTLSVSEISGGAGETASDYFYAWVGPEGQFIDSTEVSSTGSITLSNAEPGLYSLFVMDVCNNNTTDTINADLLGIEFIPNVLTPNNGDNVNDVFIVPGSHIYETRVTIMDRWGKVAFESDQYVCDRTVLEDPGTLIDHNCWQGGDDKGDVFYYMIDVDNGTCGFQGTVHILDNN